MVTQVLKSKSAYTDTSVQAVWENIEAHCTHEEAVRAVTRACDEAFRVLGREKLMRAGWGWSGGKDSLALQVVVETIRRLVPGAVHHGVCGIVPYLEFPDYLRWLKVHAPPGVEIIPNTDIDLRWINSPDKRKFLFPADSKLGYFWTMAGTRTAQRAFQAKRNPAVMLYGRRTIDGNVCGDRDGIMTAKDGDVYNPIRSWSHELTLGVAHHLWINGSNRVLPPIYSAADGWTTGTGPWAGRHRGDWTSWDDGWASTHAIDPTVLARAATVIPEARDWLRRHDE